MLLRRPPGGGWRAFQRLRRLGDPRAASGCTGHICSGLLGCGAASLRLLQSSQQACRRGGPCRHLQQPSPQLQISFVRSPAPHTSRTPVSLVLPAPPSLLLCTPCTTKLPPINHSPPPPLFRQPPARSLYPPLSPRCPPSRLLPCPARSTPPQHTSCMSCIHARPVTLAFAGQGAAEQPSPRRPTHCGTCRCAGAGGTCTVV